MDEPDLLPSQREQLEGAEQPVGIIDYKPVLACGFSHEAWAGHAVPRNCFVGGLVDDDSDGNQAGAGSGNQVRGDHRLATCLDPVVDERDALSGVKVV